MSRLSGKAYQYLERSKIPTFFFQKSLPRMKVPKLEATCQKYIDSLEPIFKSDPRFSQAKDAAIKYRDNQAKQLQQALVQYDKTVPHSSYINEFWFDMYLSSRVPLPLNFNPFLAWRDDHREKLNHQVVRSTNLLISAMRFRRCLEEEVAIPEHYCILGRKDVKNSNYFDIMKYTPEFIASYVSMALRVAPLDMSQYKNLFNSTRIPLRGKDKIVKSDPQANRHILVIKDGIFYTFDVFDQNGDLNSPEYIYANLNYIANQPSPPADYVSISELTTANRDVWADNREHLLQLSERNKANLSMLDSSIFALCLDNGTYREDDQITGAHNFLHGSNHVGPLNRWFDKSFSIIVTKDGHSSINFEHSWGDGVAILRFFNDVFEDSTERPQVEESIEKPETYCIAVKKLEFDIDARLKESIKKCRNDHLDAASKLELGAVQTSSMRRDHIIKNKLSPDAMTQLGFQMAFKKVYNKTPVTYESCSTAMYKGGRTETVRPCTNDTNNASEALIRNRLNQSMTNEEIKELLRKSSSKHFKLCSDATLGKGFDRHLFALKEIALRKNQDLPDFYKDPIYLESQHFTLSTSTLYGKCFSGGGFAPVVPDGFGLGYGYVDGQFGVLISSYKGQRNNTQFVQALNESFDDISKVLES